MGLLRNFLAFVSLSALAGGTLAPGAASKVCTVKYSFTNACELDHQNSVETAMLFDSDDCGEAAEVAAHFLPKPISAPGKKLHKSRFLVQSDLFLLHQSWLFYDTAAC